MELEVKPGAQIIFIKNDYDHRWVNGTIGTISGIDEEDTLYLYRILRQLSFLTSNSCPSSVITYNVSSSSIPEMELEVKPGAQIIFIKNDYDHRWVGRLLSGNSPCISPVRIVDSPGSSDNFFSLIKSTVSLRVASVIYISLSFSSM